MFGLAFFLGSDERHFSIVKQHIYTINNKISH